MKIGDYSKLEVFNSYSKKNQDFPELKGYENLKREGTVKITSIDGKKMNVFYMYGESVDGEIKIYSDKNNGNIALETKEVTLEDTQFFKEDLWQVMERIEKSEDGEYTRDRTDKELGFLLLEADDLNKFLNEDFKKEYDLEGIVFDREKIEAQGKLDEYLKVKDLINSREKEDLKVSNLEEDLDDISKFDNKNDIKNFKTAMETFEMVKIRVYEDKLLLTKIRKNEDRGKISFLLRL